MITKPDLYRLPPFIKWLVLTLVCLLFFTLLILLFHDFRKIYGEWSFHIAFANLLEKEFLKFLLIGFLAQTIDGALGMAYGVSAASFLMSFGVSPAITSASVHLAEVFTTGVSGLSHIKFGNIRRDLFKKLVLPGVVGAVAGSLLLSTVDMKIIKPFVAMYLIVVGLLIIKKAFGIIKPESGIRNVSILGLAGGFIDAIGGGGWGPVVTSTLLGKGQHPRFAIGSVNLAEFFVALSSSSVFTIFMGIPDWNVILGLIGGGVIAAPFSAYLCKRIPAQKLMIVVGLVIIGLSIRTLYLIFR
ncbi:sulfite exporter TauE/SafE family protein [Adhaeribacter sp. BT258]|uniref:Probable membrane transporter protein n=1 Tax=Adhaeribacter terrigena TaxID=2793070 RepID=A0ABS1BYI2_9BACT|nr:sulfite exporter TauE/SafE family protein [Adhaeribacter terrigena]MBK0402214.1 sulfite exporter TauE/SafE family protein [Adhaeribacter terrigena]